MRYEKIESSVVRLLKDGKRFLLLTHKEPDGDAIGSVLALSKALEDAGKQCTVVSEEAPPAPYDALPGAERITQSLDGVGPFDAAIVLDCADQRRLGWVGNRVSSIRPWVNIDHHETNTLFGDLNLVRAQASSTAELVYGLIRKGAFPLGLETAENIFAAIQADTGSFRYENTTPRAFRIAAEMVELGVNPWEVNLKVMDVYDVPRLRLLSKTLDTLELHLGGRLAMMTLPARLLQELGAVREDSERFVDFARFVRGVEVAAFVREIGDGEYKFSLRSNNCVNVADVARRFGGGGHARAAGFECKGPLEQLKKNFVDEVSRFLNGRGC